MLTDTSNENKELFRGIFERWGEKLPRLTYLYKCTIVPLKLVCYSKYSLSSPRKNSLESASGRMWIWELHHHAYECRHFIYIENRLIHIERGNFFVIIMTSTQKTRHVVWFNSLFMLLEWLDRLGLTKGVCVYVRLCVCLTAWMSVSALQPKRLGQFCYNTNLGHRSLLIVFRFWLSQTTHCFRTKKILLRLRVDYCNLARFFQVTQTWAFSGL